MAGFVKFMASTNGRIARGVAGLILIALGLFATTGAAQIILIVVGLVPLAAGVFDFCLFAPLGGMPIGGKDIRNS